MKPKAALKMIVDLSMTVLLFCLMAYILVGEIIHEWLGTAMFVLFILHHALNAGWHRNLIKGRYTPLRILQSGIDILLFLSVIGLMISGVIMSREVFDFLPISGGMDFARTLHMLAAYWGFLFMSLHLGLHWGMIMGKVRKAAGIKKYSAVRTIMVRIFVIFIVVFGIHAFIKNNIASYMFLRTHFVFLDMEQPLFVFFLDYIGMMGMWAAIAYYIGKFMGRIK